ncbi:MAG: hypothetical protein L3J04_07355 [Robiginitomaculum sp.]|nr:hypothetical protein [Robiginitomaculum sp.]
MNYENVRVCLFDPARHNLMITRVSLVEIGYSNIEMLTDFASFSEAAAKNTYDLIIAESHEAGGAIAELMRKIRIGEIGDNPFVVAITTSWDRDKEHLQSLINSGIDDILLRPFSTEQLKKRLQTLVGRRKDFVVTGDYVGPDRRSDTAREANSIKSFQPPNTLKAIAEGDRKALEEVKGVIIDMKADVTRERIKRLAMKIVVSMQLMLDDPEVGKALDMEDVDSTARELRRRLRGHGVPDAVELASALTEMTTEIIDPDEHSPTQFKLVRELALGAYTAFADGEDFGSDADEVKDTVSSLRKKLQKQMIDGWQSA